MEAMDLHIPIPLAFYQTLDGPLKSYANVQEPNYGQVGNTRC